MTPTTTGCAAASIYTHPYGYPCPASLQSLPVTGQGSTIIFCFVLATVLFVIGVGLWWFARRMG